MASLSDNAIASLLETYEKKLDLIIKMVARQQDMLDTLARKQKRVYYLNKQVKGLKVKIEQQKQAYDELAAFRHLE